MLKRSHTKYLLICAQHTFDYVFGKAKSDVSIVCWWEMRKLEWERPTKKKQMKKFDFDIDQFKSQSIIMMLLAVVD